jgi:hypothetical protein
MHRNTKISKRKTANFTSKNMSIQVPTLSTALPNAINHRTRELLKNAKDKL